LFPMHPYSGSNIVYSLRVRRAKDASRRVQLNRGLEKSIPLVFPFKWDDMDI